MNIFRVKIESGLFGSCYWEIAAKDEKEIIKFMKLNGQKEFKVISVYEMKTPYVLSIGSRE